MEKLNEPNSATCNKALTNPKYVLHPSWIDSDGPMPEPIREMFQRMVASGEAVVSQFKGRE